MGNTLPVTRANFETMLSNPVCHRMFGPMRRERMGKMFAELESLSFGEMREEKRLETVNVLLEG